MNGRAPMVPFRRDDSTFEQPASTVSVTSAARRSFIKTIAAGVAVGSVGSLFPSIVRAQRVETIKIGFVVPLTGPYASEAQAEVKGGELAIKEFNDAGGLKGSKAELLVRDDKLNPGEAATRTLELIENDKVSYIVGSLSASVQLSINNVTKQRGVVFVSISQSDSINEASDFGKFTFHEALNPHMTGGAVARYVLPKYGKRVVFLTADYAFGHEMVRGMQVAGKAFGIETLADIRHPIGASDYSTYFPRIQAAK